VLVIAYGCMNLVAACSSHYFGESLRGLAKVFIYLLSYFLFTAQLSFDSRRKLIFAGVLTATGALIAIYGLYQFKIGVPPLATWEDPNIEDKVTRIYATLNNPNLLAGYLVPIVPISAALSLAALSYKRWLLGSLAAFSFLILFIATILTGSRGGYLGLFAGLLALGAIFAGTVFKERPAFRPLVFASIPLVPLAVWIALHFMPSFEQRLFSIFAGREHSSNSFRMNVWLACLSMLKDNWWCGVGVGNQTFRLAYGLYMNSGFDALGTYCVPLEVAVETGVFGLVVFALLVMTTLFRAHVQFYSRQEVAWHRYIIAGAAAGLIALIVHGFVDTVFYRPQVHFIFWLLIAMLVTRPSQSDYLAFDRGR
jgi:putative inorganic carbon (HCO3(-)) transporter